MKSDIPTPALALDLDALDANLARMAVAVKRAGKALRPHAKAHKCVEIAKREIAAGASGICVATVDEAELMFKAGLSGLLLTSPLADPRKMARIVRTGAMVVVDHVQQVEWYERAARDAGRMIEVLIDIDVGDHRTGASSIQQAAGIAHALALASYLKLRGLQGYSVSGAHGCKLEERRRISEEAFRIARQIRDELGNSMEILSGGSTGTWDVDLAIPEVTELQAGTYALMDLQYGRLGIDFKRALTVIATVISANHNGFVTVDAGFKAFSTDRVFGPEATLSGSDYRWGGDEFGYLYTAEGTTKPQLGDRIEFIPPHCDPTVNLYDRFYVCRSESVEAIWPVMGRL